MKNKFIYTNKAKQPKQKEKNDSIYLNGLEFTFRNESDDTAVIDIDGAIGFDLMKYLEDEEQNTAENIKNKLRKIQASEIIVNINSLGGVINDGLVIHDYLQEHEANVTTVIRGLTASAGTIVSQGGYRKISANARILVHKAMAGMMGWFNTDDLETIIDDLNGLNDTISNLYETAGNKTADEYMDLMSEESGRGKWLSAEEAKEWGLVDEVYEPSDSENTMNATANDFKNAGMPVPDDMEDEGISVPVNVELKVNGQNYDGSLEDLKKEFQSVNQVTVEENDSSESDKDIPEEGISLEAKAREREAEILIN